MEKIQSYLLILISSVVVNSCSSLDDIKVSESKDDYNLLIVTDYDGAIYEIGNNSGKIKNVGKINKKTTDLKPSTITTFREQIYAAQFDPQPLLLVYNRQNQLTESILLQIPNSCQLKEPSIEILTYNETELIGILGENNFNDHTKRLISINIQDFKVSDLGISFNTYSVASIQQIGHKVYISTFDGFLEADLDSKIIHSLEFNQKELHGSRLAIIDRGRLAFIQVGGDFTPEGKPIEINLSNQSITDKSQGNHYDGLGKLGNTIFYNGNYLNIIYSTPYGPYGFGDTTYELEILKCNFETNKNETVKIEWNPLLHYSIPTVIGITN